MKYNASTTELSSLRDAVETRFGQSVKTPRDFLKLSEDILEFVGDRLSESTLQRIWLYKSGYSTVANHSLDVLSRYVGARDWADYLERMEKFKRSESDMSPANSVKVSALPAGARIRIAWRPDRECVLKYLGNYRFEAVETRNSKLSPGDKFTCTNLQLGRELRMDNLVRGIDEMTYIAGSRTGLTVLEVIGE